MIYFKTIYFPGSVHETHEIEDWLGMPRYISINGEALVVMGDRGMSALMSLEQKGLIQIRNKPIVTGKHMVLKYII